MIFLVLGLAALVWAGFSLVTDRGYYKGCPPGGFKREEQPINFWAPTVVLLAIGVFLIFVSLHIIPLPRR
jgi:hypothetical protein